jgi:hypothetical protein
VVLAPATKLAQIEGVAGVWGGASVSGQEACERQSLGPREGAIVDDSRSGCFVVHKLPRSVGLEGSSFPVGVTDPTCGDATRPTFCTMRGTLRTAQPSSQRRNHERSWRSSPRLGHPNGQTLGVLLAACALGIYVLNVSRPDQLGLPINPESRTRSATRVTPGPVVDQLHLHPPVRSLAGDRYRRRRPLWSHINRKRRCREELRSRVHTCLPRPGVDHCLAGTGLSV